MATRPSYSTEDLKRLGAKPYTGEVKRGIGGSTAPAPDTARPVAKPAPTLEDRILNVRDQIGLATGFIDPATYRGRDPTPQAPSISAPAPVTGFDRFVRGASEVFSTAGQGVNSEILRKNQDFRQEEIIRTDAQNRGLTPEQADALVAQNRASNTRIDLGARDQRALRDEADPVWNPNRSFIANLMQGAGYLGGEVLGDLNPTYAISPGNSFATRALAQGGVNAATDAAVQSSEIDRGLMSEFNASRLGLNFAVGTGFQAGSEGIGALAGKVFGARAAPVVDPDLTPQSLEGDIVLPPDVGATLATSGATPANIAAMSPDFAEFAAQRLASARARQSVAPQAPPRVVPDDTQIIAAPEGNIRSDDAGGIAGVDRKRAADDAVLGEAGRLADDPTIAEILNAPVSAQTKIRTLADRIMNTVSDSGEARPSPYTAPTREQAASTFQPNIEADATKFIMRDLEGGGKPVVDSGGATRFGISRNANPDVNVANLDEAGAAKLYRDRYYKPMALDGLDPDLQLVAYDAAINHGVGKAKQLLKESGGDPAKLIALRQTEYDRLILQDPEKYAKYGKGWSNRLAKLEAKLTGNKSGDATDYRMSAPDEAGDGFYSAMDRVRRNLDDPMSPPVREDFQGFEKTEFPTSPTNAAREAGNPAANDSRIQTGGSTRAFKAVSDDPEGQPGFFENRARKMSADAQAKAQSELEAEWARRAEARAQADAERAQSQDGRTRAEAERTQASNDPSGQYKGKYAQRPIKTGDYFDLTPEGYVAGKDGNPVAFRNSKDAARFAVKEQLGGDFDRVVYAANSQRVVLQRREGSNYGQSAPETGPAKAPRTEFERANPPAGRSDDISQRQIASERPVEAPAPQSASAVRQAPYRSPAPTTASPAPISRGNPVEEVVTPRGRSIATQFEVVEARDLISSSDAGFDQRFQPRERGTRSSSDAQIADIASRLDPEQLGSSRLASQGAPITGPDRMVESGNGRVAAIRRAYELNPERGAAYRKMVEGRGFDTKGMDQPVLVRRRTTELDDDGRAAFVREANERDTMGLSSAEQAKSDSGAMSEAVLARYRGGDVTEAGNRDFVRAWMDEVATPADRNTLQMADGSLSSVGITRLRSSMLAKAFDDPQLIARIIEDPDNGIKTIGQQLTESAPAFAAIKSKVAAGDLPREFDVTPQIAEMAKLIAKARETGAKVGDLISQTDIFSGRIDPVTEAITRMMFAGDELKQARSGRAIGEGLRFYTDEVRKIQSGPSMFGDDLKPLSPVEIIQAANAKLNAKAARDVDTTADMFTVKRPGAFMVRSSEQRLKRLRSELANLAKSSDKPEYAALAAKLADIVDDGDVIAYGRNVMDDVSNRGEARPGDGYVTVRDAADAETILHEAIHMAAMSRYGYAFDRLRAGDLAIEPTREFLSIFNEARDAFKRGGMLNKLSTDPLGIQYALTNPDEFLAMALTDPSTQKFLARGSLWDRVVDGVRKLFGLEAKFTPLLDRAIRAGTDILEAARTDPVRNISSGRAPLARPGDPIKGIVDSLIDGADLKADLASMRKAVGDPIEALGNLTRPLRSAISTATFTNDAVMRALSERFNSPAIAEWADKFNARAGKGDGTERTYHEAVQRASAVPTARTQEALGDIAKNPASLRRVRDLLASPKSVVRGTPAEREAASKISAILKETIEYRKAAGEDIGEVTDGYFPRVLDVEKVAKGREKFLAAAEKLYRSVGAEDAQFSAEAWFARVFDQYAGLDGGLEHIKASGAGGIGGNTAKARQFGKEAERLLADFYHDDVFQTLASYFTGSARRAEEVRRFGAKGAVGSTERADWVAQNGDKTQLEVMFDQVRSDMRNSDKDAGDALHRIEVAHKANLGRLGTASHNTRTLISYAHAWNQLGKLDRAVITSLGEMTMGFIRGGPRSGVPFVANTVREFTRKVRGADPSDASRWAEAIGVSQDAMVNQALTARIDAEGSTQGIQKVMAGFYQGIGLHQYTEATRIASVTMGRKMLSTFAGDLASPSARVRTRSERYLKELGISDPAKFAESLKRGEPDLESIRRDDPGLARDYTTALTRFVNQTVMAPNRAVKPAYAAHPVGSLFYSLMGYSYGFKKNVLDRAGRMALDGFKDKDPALLLPAAMLPIMGVFQYYSDTYLRPELFGSNYDFENETPDQLAMRVADRSGALPGFLSPITNAFKAIKYDRSPLEAVSGSVVGSLANAGERLITPFTEKNSENNNNAERNAAAAVYETFVEPVADAVGAKYLKGIARTAAIVSTGNKGGGVLPGDKDAFINTVAGEKE